VRAFKKTLLIGSGAALVSLLVATAVGAVFCNFSLHVFRRDPGHMPAELYPGGDWRTVSMRASDGAALQAWFVTPRDKPRGRCVAVLHGIADSRIGAVGFAPMFLDDGYSVLLPDSRGHGLSGGEFVTYGLMEKRDVLNWVHRMRDEGCTAIYGLGESLGGSLLIQASALEPVFRAIVAECPFADLEAAAEVRVRRLLPLPNWFSETASRVIVTSGMLYAKERFGLDFARVTPVNAMRQTKTPVLLIHGLEDDRTPFGHSQQLARANAAAALWLVPHAAHVHASSADPGGFRRRVLDWFARH